jgi:polyhydroxyalkanoate synthesis regulator phasin
MPLPKQIQAQMDAADAALRQAYPETHGSSDGLTPAADPVPPIPVETVQASEPPPQAQPQPEPKPQPPPASEDWEQKYRTLQGIHNKHVGDLKARLEQLEASNQQLLDRLNASPPPTAQAQPATMNSQDAETFGEDLVRMIQRTAEQTLGPVAQSVEQRLATLEQSLQGTNKVVAQTADEAFFSALREQVPDFDQINTSDPFLAWLAEEDDLSGNQRQAALTAAGNARDLKRVVKVFNTFKRAAGVATEPASERKASRLEAQVSPRSTGNGATPATTQASGKPMITVEQVERFYADVRRGAYRGNDKLRADTEAVINDALADNRIVQRGVHRPAL